MAATILQIIEGIEARLDTIAGLRVAGYSPDQINPPQASVEPPEISDYRLTFRRGYYDITPTVTLFTSAASDRAGQRALMEYMAPIGALSVAAAIEGDPTLGGIADSCVVQSFAPLGLEQVGAIGYYGGVFQLRVLAQGV